MDQDIRGAFIGLHISVLGTALLAIWSNPDETSPIGMIGAIVLIVGIIISSKYLS
jgi:hypothetical protein